MKGKKLITVVLLVMLTTVLFTSFIGEERIPVLEVVRSMEGSGSEDDPYMIYDVHDLQNMSQDLSAHYALANDIDASETQGWNQGAGFNPVGDEDEHFSGSFDGSGHTISNLYIDRSDEDYFGLFGSVGRDAEVSNVTITDSTVIGNKWGGVLMGNNRGRVHDVHVHGTLVGEDNIGGLIGFNEGDDVSSSSSSVQVDGGSYVGGLIGFNWYGDVHDCLYQGDVTGTDIIGGLIGLNSGNIYGSDSSGTVLANGGRVGGLLGFNGGNVTNSYSTSHVDGEGRYVGGLIGYNCFGFVSESYASGNVTGRTAVGGLLGWNDGTMLNSYSTGDVQGLRNVGGSVGINYIGLLKNIYSSGVVSGSEEVGGLLGENRDGSVEASFWDVESSGTQVSDGGIGKTSLEMKDVNTFSDAGWDITAIETHGDKDTDHVWNIVDGETYPFLSGSEEVEDETDDDEFARDVILIGFVLIIIIAILYPVKNLVEKHILKRKR